MCSDGASLDKTDSGIDGTTVNLSTSGRLRIVGTSEGVTVGPTVVASAIDASEGCSVFKAAVLAGASTGNTVGGEIGVPVEGDAIGA